MRIKEMIINWRTLTVEQILLASIVGNVKRTVWRICSLILGCKGLKTSCSKLYIWRVLLEYIIVVIKCKCLVHIILWSSTLPPWRVPCVHKNWSSVPLAGFLATKIKKRTTPKNIFKDTSTMVGTHNWHVWVKHVKH